MIFTCRIGDYETGLDDELVEERPTPELALDYLTRCAQVVHAMYDAGLKCEAEQGNQ
jgi:hypothetical protein